MKKKQMPIKTSPTIGFRDTAFREHLLTGKLRPVTVIGKSDADLEFLAKACIALLFAVLALTVVL